MNQVTLMTHSSEEGPLASRLVPTDNFFTRLWSHALGMKESLLDSAQRVSPRGRRVIAGTIVAVLHALLAYILILGLAQKPSDHQDREMILSFSPGGPRIIHVGAPQPTLVVPNEPTIPPPEVTVDDTSPTNSILAAAATGGPSVTLPAEAIGETHTAPSLSDDLLTLARQTALRLRLLIATDGSVSDAVVENSSGSGEVDRLTLAWVKSHWLYRPAMRDGVAISETTTALVPFR